MAKHEELWSDEEIAKVIDLWGLKDEQVEQLRLLKESLKDLDYPYKNNPYDAVRFIIFHKQADAAEAAFRKMVELRKKYDIDSLMQDYQPSEELLRYYPIGLLKGLDKDGDPIWMTRLGVTDAAGLLSKFGADELFKYNIWTREIVYAGAWRQEFEAQAGRPFRNMTVIADLQGLSMKQRKAMGEFNKIMRMGQDIYPALSKRTIVLRAPAIFRVLWAVAKHFFDPFAASIMVFTGPNNYKEALSQYMDLEVVPECICEEGKGVAIDGMSPTFVGGPVPDS